MGDGIGMVNDVEGVWILGGREMLSSMRDRICVRLAVRMVLMVAVVVVKLMVAVRVVVLVVMLCIGVMVLD